MGEPEVTSFRQRLETIATDDPKYRELRYLALITELLVCLMEENTISKVGKVADRRR